MAGVWREKEGAWGSRDGEEREEGRGTGERGAEALKRKRGSETEEGNGKGVGDA